MSAKKQECPRCDEKLERRARVDSDDRIEATWLYCYGCGWDQRKDRPKIQLEDEINEAVDQHNRDIAAWDRKD